MSKQDLTGFNGLAKPQAPPGPRLDMARYRALLGDTDLTDQEAAELLGILTDIMRSFVELGFDVDSCGQLAEGLVKNAVDDQGDVES